MTLRNRKIWGTVVLFSIQSSLFACWGTRPLTMGGAFVSVADDVHSIYWNPAGLGKIEMAELTSTHLMNLREEASYDDFVAVAIPLKYGALGIGYAYDGETKKMYVDKDNNIKIKTEDYYLNIGYGFSFKDVALGFNFKIIATELNYSGMAGGIPLDYSDSGSVIPLDFGLLWNMPHHLTFGILCQNFNEPSLKLSDSELKYFANIRPALAWRPNPTTTFSLEIYDLLNNSKGASGRDISIGMEKKFNEYISLRAGGYHINNSDKSMVTAGIGITLDRWSFDYGIMTGSDIDTSLHLLSFGYKF